MNIEWVARWMAQQEAFRDVLLRTAGALCDLVAAFQIEEAADEIATADDGEFDNRVADLLSDRWEAPNTGTEQK